MKWPKLALTLIKSQKHLMSVGKWGDEKLPEIGKK